MKLLFYVKIIKSLLFYMVQLTMLPLAGIDPHSKLLIHSLIQQTFIEPEAI